MGQIRERMEQDLCLRGVAENTKREYLKQVRYFVAHYKQSPDQLGPEHVRAWLLYLLTVKRLKPSSVNMAMAALRFLYVTTLRRPEVVRGLRRIPPTIIAPDVLSGRDVQQLLEHTESLKYRAMFMLMYGSGLRISETLALTVDDIDSSRMVIRVRAPKNRRDRIVPLPARTLDVLRAYWKQFRPQRPHLFPGADPSRPLTRPSVREALRTAAQRGGIKKRVHPHLLRHGYATHSLELGTDIRTVQILLGHNTIHSTLLHASDRGAAQRFAKSSAGTGHQGGTRARIAACDRAQHLPESRRASTRARSAR